MTTTSIPRYQRENAAMQIRNAAKMLTVLAHGRGITDLALRLERDRLASGRPVSNELLQHQEDQLVRDQEKIAAFLAQIDQALTLLLTEPETVPALNRQQAITTIRPAFQDR